MTQQGSHEALTPVPDNPAGEILPGGRGVVDHGVPWQAAQELPDEMHYQTGEPVEVMPEEQAPDPIPVRVVNKGSREVRDFATSQRSLLLSQQTPVVLQVAGRDENRTKITVQVIGNTDGDPVRVYVGGPQVDWRSGYLVTNGKELPLTTTEPVFICADTEDGVTPAEDIRVAVVQEFSRAVT